MLSPPPEMKILSEHLPGHRGKVVPRYWRPLIAVFEKWKENLDNGGECGALFVHLSKTFDCLQYDLLLTKLNIGSITNLLNSS